jgi:hypothetical protein
MYKYIIVTLVSLLLGLVTAHVTGLGPVLATHLGLAMSSRDYYSGRSAKKTKAGSKAKSPQPAQTQEKPPRKESLASMSREEVKKYHMTEANIRLDVLRDPRMREGQELKLYREYDKGLALYFKYNSLPLDVKKRILTVLAGGAFAANEAILIKMAETGEAPDEEKKMLLPGFMDECRAQLRRLTDEGAAAALAGLMENWPQTPGAWADADRFACFMQDNAAPLENAQVNLLVERLIAAKARPEDDSVRDIMRSLLTPGQLEAFDKFIYTEALRKDYMAFHKETVRRVRNAVWKWGKN